MDEKKENNAWWLWFVIPIAALTTWKLFRNTAKNRDKAVEEMTISEAQAAKFYAYFGITIAGPVVTATPIVLDSTLRQVGWLARNIYNWDDCQKAFRQMCGGNYTIIQAATMAMSTAEYSGFINVLQAAQTQKRIFCGNNNATTLYNADRYGGFAGESFDANKYVGRCTQQDDMYYYYVSWRDGVTYQAPKTQFVIK